jgi:dienelactone hydrolase
MGGAPMPRNNCTANCKPPGVFNFLLFNRREIDTLLRMHFHFTVALLALLMFGQSIYAAEAKRLSPDELTSIKELPNPFVFNDGTAVKTRQDWQRRRAELRELVLTYEYGHVAPPPGNVRGDEKSSQPIAGVEGATEKQITLSMGPGGQLKSNVVLSIPAGKGPFPVIVKGDLGWGRVKPEIVANVIKHGYMLAEFDRTDFAPDKDDKSTGVYPLFPGEDWSALGAWAWGFARVNDYLLTRNDVDPKRLIVTGHSRGGKAALLAGALDERVALTAPNNSGCGGAGCYRLQAPKSETIADITKHFPYWFQPQFTQFIGHIDKLPIDQHSVKALVAPRALLSTEALGDLWANPEGSQQTYLAAKEVYKFLGAADRIAIHFREGKHEQNEQDFATLLDYADHLFNGKPASEPFDRLAFPDSPKQFSWTAPKGE